MARVELLTAGWTEHPGAVARRGAGWAPVRFPALVALIEHPRGRVLFDTGYAPRVPRLLRRGIDRLYGTLLPVHLDPAQSVLAQLHARGLDATDIDWVVLSHLHADHVGGLLDFPAAQVVADPAAVAHAQGLRGPGRLRRGVVSGLLPGDLPHRVVDPVTLPVGRSGDFAPLGPAHDLFGDGELLVLPLPGHAPGHSSSPDERNVVCHTDSTSPAPPGRGHPDSSPTREERGSRPSAPASHKNDSHGDLPSLLHHGRNTDSCTCPAGFGHTDPSAEAATSDERRADHHATFGCQPVDTAT